MSQTGGTNGTDARHPFFSEPNRSRDVFQVKLDLAFAPWRLGKHPGFHFRLIALDWGFQADCELEAACGRAGNAGRGMWRVERQLYGDCRLAARASWSWWVGKLPEARLLWWSPPITDRAGLVLVG